MQDECRHALDLFAHRGPVLPAEHDVEHDHVGFQRVVGAQVRQPVALFGVLLAQEPALGTIDGVFRFQVVGASSPGVATGSADGKMRCQWRGFLKSSLRESPGMNLATFRSRRSPFT